MTSVFNTREQISNSHFSWFSLLMTVHVNIRNTVRDEGQTWSPALSGHWGSLWGTWLPGAPLLWLTCICSYPSWRTPCWLWAGPETISQGAPEVSVFQVQLPEVCTKLLPLWEKPKLFIIYRIHMNCFLPVFRRSYQDYTILHYISLSWKIPLIPFRCLDFRNQ